MNSAIRIGFTGHRDLAPTLNSPAKAAREQILARFVTSFNKALAKASGKCNIHWSSGLAEGSDLVVCKALSKIAADRTVDVNVSINPVSPFAWNEFRRDIFDEGTRSLADNYWGTASCRVEINPEIERPANVKNPEDLPISQQAYADLSDWIVEQSDVVIALVNEGREYGGKGGAGWVLDQAKKSKTPWIRLCFFHDETEKVEVSSSFVPNFSFGGKESSGRTSPLNSLVRELTTTLAQPPPRRTVDGKIGSQNKPKWESSESIYTREKVVGDRSLFARKFSEVFSNFEKLFAGKDEVVNGENASQPKGPGSGKRDNLYAEFKTADSLAIYYNGLHRTTYASMYVLGFFAVLLAVLGHQIPHTPLITKLELAALLGILALYQISHHFHFRTRGTDYRLLAELFRASMNLRLLGLRLPFPPLGIHDSGSEGALQDSWMAHYVDLELQKHDLVELVSSPGVMPKTISFNADLLTRTSEHLQATWLQNQFHYFDRTSKRYRRLEHRLHFVLFCLFGLTGAACLTHYISDSSWFAGIKDYSIYGTVVGPALAASLLGIATHSEWARLHRLYAARSNHYLNSSNELKKATTPEGSKPTRRDLANILKPLAVTSIQEVSDWRWLHAVNDPTL